MKEKESNESDTLRNAKHPLLTYICYISVQSRGQFCLSNRQSTDSLFGPFTYLWGLKGPILINNHNLSRERGLSLSRGIKKSKAAGFMEHIVAPVSDERFTCFPLKA